MQSPKYRKTILICASFFAVLAFVIVFIQMTKDNSQTSRLLQTPGILQPSDEQTNSEVLIFSGDTSNGVSKTECVSQDFFTSLPAKCLTSDGKLIQVNGVPSEPIVIP